MLRSIARFVLNDEGNIIDTAHRLPLTSACPCGCCPESHETESDKQIYLRRCVLNAQLSVLSQKCESLCAPEADSRAQVIYSTIYVLQLDWMIGQAVKNWREGSPDRSPHAHDLSPISVFVDEVAVLLLDIYGDCDQYLLDSVLESIRVIAVQWDRARTASSRDFFERLSEQVNVPALSLDDASLAPYAAIGGEA
jgi:hypothetical protein